MSTVNQYKRRCDDVDEILTPCKKSRTEYFQTQTLAEQYIIMEALCSEIRSLRNRVEALENKNIERTGCPTYIS